MNFFFVLLISITKIHSQLLNGTTFQCSSSFRISSKMLCDGYADCLNGRDELFDECNRSQCEFKCNSNECTLNKYRCDGIDHCIDGSDEINCNIEDEKRSNCNPKTQYKCSSSLDNNHECISLSKMCDSIRDCFDGSDEWPIFCMKYKCNQVNQFKCEWNGACLNLNQTCDGINDCGDNSDEIGCIDSITNDTQTNFHCAFKCTADDICLNEAQLCDHHYDCADGEDERICNYTLCSNRLNLCGNDLNTICRVKPFGKYECNCKKGFLFDEEHKICRDLNECEHNICPQICINTFGSYICECNNGYQYKHGQCLLANDTNYFSNELIFLYTDQNRLFRYDYRENLTELQFQFDSVNYMISNFDFSYEQELILFHEIQTNSIFIYSDAKQIAKFYFNLTENFSNDNTTLNLAYDWINCNLYFTKNSSLYVLGPINYESQTFIWKLLLKDIFEIRSLIVSPLNKLLFWIDWAYGSIESTTLDGDNRHVILKDLNHPYALNLDSASNRLYWFETGQDGLFTCDVHGNNFYSVFIKLPQKPLQMTIYEGTVYFIYDSKINKLNVSTNFKKVLIKKDMNRLIQLNGSNKLRVTNRLSQPATKAWCNCGKCLCLPHGSIMNKNFSCICNDSINNINYTLVIQRWNARINDISTRLTLTLIIFIVVALFAFSIQVVIRKLIYRKKLIEFRAIYKCRLIKNDCEIEVEPEITQDTKDLKSHATSTYALHEADQNIYETPDL